MMMALIMMTIIKQELTNHLYTFGGNLYRQKSSGPIGEDITNMASKLVMYDLVVEYKKKYIDIDIAASVRFVKIYVDDLNQGGNVLPYGSVYVGGGFTGQV